MVRAARVRAGAGAAFRRGRSGGRRAPALSHAADPLLEGPRLTARPQRCGARERLSARQVDRPNRPPSFSRWPTDRLICSTVTSPLDRSRTCACRRIGIDRHGRNGRRHLRSTPCNGRSCAQDVARSFLVTIRTRLNEVAVPVRAAAAGTHGLERRCTSPPPLLVLHSGLSTHAAEPRRSGTAGFRSTASMSPGPDHAGRVGSADRRMWWTRSSWPTETFGEKVRPWCGSRRIRSESTRR